MATLDEFFQKTKVAGQELDALSVQYKAYLDNLKTLQGEDPCVKGFGEKLDALFAQAEEYKVAAQQFSTSLNSAVEAYNSLGFFDKRDPAASSALNTVLNNRKALTALGTQVTAGGTKGKDYLREQYNSCPVLKDPEEEEDTNEDPGANEDPNSENENQNEDDEDRGDNTTGSGDEPTTNSDTSGSNPSGSTQSGKSGANAAKKDPKPNKRQRNPLGELSSYTYNITLYIITPEAYEAFIGSGRKDINAILNAESISTAQQLQSSGAGAYVIAQSGGINNNNDSQRAPSFQYDYYIDNLKLVSNTSAKSSGTNTNTTSIEFTITEPYGFSFISNLKRARDAIMAKSKLPNAQKARNALKQFFVLGLRFYGYNKNGGIAYASDFDNGTGTSTIGGGSQALFERFYDIDITEVNFKIDGKAVVYNIKAANLPEQKSMTTRNGRITKDIQVQATTVYNALMADNDIEIGLLASLNKQQKKMKDDGGLEIPNEYDVVFVGDSDDLKNAALVLDSDRDKRKSAMVAKKSSTSTDEISITAVPDLATRQIKFKNDTAILQAISLIIGQSDYLYKAMNTVFTSKTEPDTNGNDKEEPGGKKRIRWYNLGAQVSIKGFDNIKKDWAYKITYVIQPYETPVIATPYTNAPKPYYGPHKRYDYWFTGQNSEILNYQQTLNNTFFITALDNSAKPADGNAGHAGSAEIPSQGQMRTASARQGTTGKGYEAQNTYITSLSDPKNFAEAKISILGDPDFLINTSPNDISAVYDPYYASDGFTINANGGQVFIEIDFKEPTDYVHQDGLLSINESIQFYEVPKGVRDLVKGVSYEVISVTSTFRSGRFEQELKLNINSFSGFKDEKSSENQRQDKKNEDAGRPTEATGTAQTTSGSSQEGDGLTPYKEPEAPTPSGDATENVPDKPKQPAEPPQNQETAPVQNTVNNPEIQAKIDQLKQAQEGLQQPLQAAKNDVGYARDTLSFAENSNKLPIVINGQTFETKEAAVTFARHDLLDKQATYAGVVNKWNNNIADIQKLQSQLSTSTSTQGTTVADDDRRG